MVRLTEYSPNAQRSALVAITTSGVPIGTMLSALIGMVVLPGVGWRPMYFIGFIPLIMVVLLYLFSPESIARLIKNGDKEQIRKTLKRANRDYIPHSDDEYVTGSSKVQKASFASLFRDGLAANTILFWLLFGMSMFTVYGMVTWLPKLMMTAGYALGSSLQLMFTYTLGAIPGMFLSGPITDRIGFKKSLMAYSLIPAILAIPLATKPSAIVTSILLFLVGAGIYGLMSVIYLYVATSYPSVSRGTGLGWASALGRLGGSFGPTIGGILVAQKASLTTNFVAFIIVPLVLAAILGLLTKDITRSEINRLSSDQTHIA